MKEPKKGLWYKFWNRDGKGIDVAEDKTPTLKRFFKLLWRNLGKILSLNILMVLIMIPVAIAVYKFLTGPTQPTQNDILFAPLYGVAQFESSPAFLLSWVTKSGLLHWAAYHSSAYIWMAVMLFIVWVLWGWVNVGSTYVLRGIVRGDAVFVGSDFFYGIKRNFWSGLGLGALDFFIMGLLAFDWIFFYNQLGYSFLFNVLYVILMLIIVLYFFMRFYIYPMFITFKLSLRKLLKNALIFTALGVKRNIMALLGIAVLTVLNGALVVLLIPRGIVFPLILPFVHYLAFTSFMIVYASYPVLQKYMIDPYIGSSQNDSGQDPEEDEDPGDADPALEQPN